mgnify:CR=1 FL=1
MTKYEAETKKQYSANAILVTAKNKIAHYIDGRWIYSMHWTENDWVEQARKDLKKRQGKLAKKHNELLLAQQMLDSIED